MNSNKQETAIRLIVPDSNASHVLCFVKPFEPLGLDSCTFSIVLWAFWQHLGEFAPVQLGPGAAVLDHCLGPPGTGVLDKFLNTLWTAFAPSFASVILSAQVSA